MKQSLSDGLTSSLWPLAIPFALIVSIQFVGAFLPGNSAWGFNLWTIWPVWAAFIALASYTILTVTILALSKHRFAGQIRAESPGPLFRISPPVFWLFACTVFGATGWVFRSRAMIYGDGFTAVSLLDRPLTAAFAGIHDYLRPLNILLQVAVKQSLPQSLAADSQLVFWLLSVGGGVAGLSAIVVIARTLFKGAMERLLMFALTLTSGCTVLLLGWVELYVWPTAALLWLLAVAIVYVNGNLPYWSVVLSATIAVGFDVLLFPPALATLAIVMRLRDPNSTFGRLSPKPSKLFLLVGVCAIVLGVCAHFTWSFFFVPIWHVEGHPYWVLGAKHLTDVLNLLVYVAPVGLIAAMTILKRRSLAGIFKDSPTILFGLSAWAAFLVSFWIDPKLGAARDWDLLSFYGFPLSLMGAYVLVKSLHSNGERFFVFCQALTVGVILLLPNVYEKTNLSTALARIEPLTWNDPHYQVSYKQAYGCIAWGAILHHQCGRSDLAEKCFRRRIAAFPECKFAWYNMGIVAFDRQKYDQAVDYFGRALNLNPKSEQYAKSLQSAQVQALRQRIR